MAKAARADIFADLPILASLAEVKALTFVGNHYSDARAFRMIHEFVKREDISRADKFAAIDFMGRKGMGLAPLDDEGYDFYMEDLRLQKEGKCL